MQLTRYTDYSFRVLIYLSLHKDRSATISEIADFYQISRNHLVKVVHNLSVKNYLNSSRGKGGGLKLARSPELINVGSVVRDTEPNFYAAECFNNEPSNCSIEVICHLKNILAEATEHFLDTLGKYTIADIITDKISSDAAIELDPEIKRVLSQTIDNAATTDL